MISLSKTLVTVDATRRRAIGQILLLSAGFLVLVAISTTSVVLVNQSRKDNGWVVHTIEVQNQMNALLLEVRRAESATRGFLLTSEPRFRTEYETATAAAIADVDELKTLTRDNPAQIRISSGYSNRSAPGWQSSPTPSISSTIMMRPLASRSCARPLRPTWPSG